MSGIQRDEASEPTVEALQWLTEEQVLQTARHLHVEAVGQGSEAAETWLAQHRAFTNPKVHALLICGLYHDILAHTSAIEKDRQMIASLLANL